MEKHKYQVGQRVSIKARWLKGQIVVVTINAQYIYNPKWYTGIPIDNPGSHGRFFDESDVVGE